MTAADAAARRAGRTAGDDELPLLGGRRRRLAGRPAVRRGRPAAAADRARPPGFDGDAAAVPGARAGLAGLPRQLGLGGVLADDMGLGKTVQTAGAARRRPSRTAAADAAGLPDVAGRQLAAGGGAVHPGAAGARPPRRGAARGARSSPRRSRGADLVLTTYALAARDAGGAGRDRLATGWSCDEAQAHQERGDPAGRRRSARCPARHRIALTGTPVENRLADLWSIMEFANPGLLGPGRDVPGAVRGADRAARRRGGGRSGCAGSPARSSCAGSRPTSRSSPTCRRSWR